MRSTPAARRAPDDMAQHRQARHLVQHLGQRGLHAGAGARGQDNGSFAHMGVSRTVLPQEKGEVTNYDAYIVAQLS